MNNKIRPVDTSSLPDFETPCPFCSQQLRYDDFLVPGQKILGHYTCIGCREEFYGDLACDYGIFAPTLYSIAEKTMYGGEKRPFWRLWSEKILSPERLSSPAVSYHEYRKVRKPALLNCLDVPYGHMLLKLFHSSFYLEEHADYDLIMIVPSSLLWMVPEGTAAVIKVDWDSSCHTHWCDTVARKVSELRSSHPTLHYCPTLPTPDRSNIDISMFTGSKPFDREAWQLEEGAPTVVYVWREDRVWSTRDKDGIDEQFDHVINLGKALRKVFPKILYVVAGLGNRRHALPDWIIDQRHSNPTESVEKEWVSLYSTAHVTIGIHGSNMIIPSSLSGATIELVPADRWHLAWTASSLRGGHDNVATMFYHRFVPRSISPDELAQMIHATINYAKWARIYGMFPNADLFNTDIPTLAKQSKSLSPFSALNSTSPKLR